MQKTIKVLVLLLTILLSSCVSKKKIIYFQNDQISQTEINNTYKTIFKPDDLLQITVSSIDLEAVKPFNLPAVSFSTTNTVVGNPQQQNYLIDNSGFIDFPILGKIKIAGLSRAEAIKLLKDRLDPEYVKKPTINIRISNFTVTILGDVKKPGTYTVPDERITVLEVIGLAGDLNISGVRDIEVIREENKEKKVYKIDLRSKKVFSSPAYYLQQNDVVYIKPNKSSYQDAAYNKNTGLFISLSSVLVALISVLTR